MTWNQQQIQTIAKAVNDFPFFIREIFARSFDNEVKTFVGGQFIENTANFLQNSKYTMRVSARDHFKSTSIYAHFMWQMIKRRKLEAHYFSFQRQMAAYHIGKLKQTIAANPYYQDIIDLKPTAESIIKYRWPYTDPEDRANIFEMEPHGMLGFKRGIHCPIIYVDDAFHDPASKLVLTIIIKINNIFRTEIIDMPSEELHVVGTAQTNDDFYFDMELREMFKVKVLPAVISDAKQEVLWPEWLNYEQLMALKKAKTPRIFNQEYMCVPTYAEEAFFRKEQIMAVVNVHLKNLNVNQKHEIKDDVIAGFDIGKKRHPAHLSVFKKIGEKYIEIHQKFMDGWDYAPDPDDESKPSQLEYLKKAIKNLCIDELYYDNTRGEFESLGEEGRLPHQMKPIVFNNKCKQSMSTAFSKVVEQKQIELIDDQRQINQLLVVTNDLQAIETPEGHGDSFWSIALCMKREPGPSVRFI